MTLASYARAGRLLSIQIDAAINPGNSGGPAFADMQEGIVAGEESVRGCCLFLGGGGLCLLVGAGALPLAGKKKTLTQNQTKTNKTKGVAFSKNVSSSTDNIGYIIPRPVVQHFLDEYAAHGRFRGLVSQGFASQPMENPAQRAFLRLPPGASGGCTVTKLEPMSEAAQHLEVIGCLFSVGLLVVVIFCAARNTTESRPGHPSSAQTQTQITINTNHETQIIIKARRRRARGRRRADRRRRDGALPRRRAPRLQPRRRAQARRRDLGAQGAARRRGEFVVVVMIDDDDDDDDLFFFCVCVCVCVCVFVFVWLCCALPLRELLFCHGTTDQQQNNNNKNQKNRSASCATRCRGRLPSSA